MYLISWFRILRVARYDTVHDGLRLEGVGRVLPGVTSLDAGLATFAQLYGQQGGFASRCLPARVGMWEGFNLG
eukprot:s77_g27.t1